jgi:sugar O-acyltransferase (sialic acid O-acetyltransferase NeuD family)
MVNEQGFIIIGAGGLATQILDVLERLYPFDYIDFFDNINEYPKNPKKFNRKIHTSIDSVLSEYRSVTKKIVMGVSLLNSKKDIYAILANKDVVFTKVISKSALIGKNNLEIGEGTVVLENCIIESNVHIGKLCLINTSSRIFHDCIIGDYTEIAPNCSILGRCKIGENVFIGSGSTILPGLTIGDNVIIGAGSLVTKNIDSNQTVKGSPAK